MHRTLYSSLTRALLCFWRQARAWGAFGLCLQSTWPPPWRGRAGGCAACCPGFTLIGLGFWGLCGRLSSNRLRRRGRERRVSIKFPLSWNGGRASLTRDRYFQIRDIHVIFKVLMITPVKCIITVRTVCISRAAGRTCGDRQVKVTSCSALTALLMWQAVHHALVHTLRRRNSWLMLLLRLMLLLMHG